MKKTTLFSFVLLCVFSFSQQLFSQQVSIQFQHKTGYVGVPIPLYVVFENISQKVEPQLPAIDGFTIYKQLSNRTSEQTTFIQGKVTTTRRTIFTFILTPTTAGTFTIPSLKFKANGKTFQSTPRIITIEEPPTSGVLEAEITGTQGEIFLGRPVDLTLRIFMEAFTDPNSGITPDAQFMFRRLRNDSNFGIFTEALENGNAKVQRVQGTSENGIPTTFFVFSVQATTWPETTGTLELEPIVIKADYPLAVSKPRRVGFFGSNQPVVEQSTLLSATAELPTIDVLSPPSNGQPAWFSGAVGHFDFRIVAEPTRIKVGEPITLTMRVTDLTSGPVNLDYLSAPLLDRVSALTDSFKVPDKSLGGTVNGRTKIFTQTIRPRDDSPSEIPPLPFTSFNPENGEYITAWSKPIPIQVEAVATVSAGDLIGASNNHTIPTSPIELDGGILANYAGDDLLLSQRVDINSTIRTAIVLPPIIFFSILLIFGIRKHAALPSSKQKGTRKVATKTLQNAMQLSSAEQAVQISKAIRVLQSNATIDDGIAEKMNELIERCNATQFGGLSDAELGKDAVALVEQIR
ncbi:MAG TPA: hypothetical protein EYO01_00285 [Phycisphaerales bacterium]|nr:hypothetical protein [Phycisphaerales bacterium]HIB50861.1 hypothetical protein [Phycisphaerales bacterium]HIN84457.1 hypothetical protein [Phycisphaerales bacterium]HIO52027.1 hypothetical protein [Phycisphaerales bacterium]